jgi:hypothetical protein
LKKQSAATTSANVASYTRPSLQTLTKDTGTIAKFPFSECKDQQLKNIEQSRSDREARKSRLQPDLSFDFQSHQGDFVYSSPAYTGMTRV